MEVIGTGELAGLPALEGDLLQVLNGARLKSHYYLGKQYYALTLETIQESGIESGPLFEAFRRCGYESLCGEGGFCIIFRKPLEGEEKDPTPAEVAEQKIIKAIAELVRLGVINESRANVLRMLLTTEED